MVDTLTGGAHSPPDPMESGPCQAGRHGLCPTPNSESCWCLCHVLSGHRDQEPADLPGPDPAPTTPEPAGGWAPARLAYTFYATAAAGAVVGQVWVALVHIPFSPGWPMWAQIAAVLPFALCLELLGMATAAMADQRQRAGERAYGFRALSGAVAAAAVGVILAGHWPHIYQVAGFGALSAAAYVLWLLHSAARRRDALRAAGKLAQTAPSYGWYRRVRHPVLTGRAAELARAGGLDLYASLRAAELAVRAEARRPAIAAAVERAVRADHADPRMAEIAATTLDLDRIAAELEARADYAGWADRLAPAVLAHRPPEAEPAGRNSSAPATRNRSGRSTGRNRNGTRNGSAGTVPGGAAERIRALAEEHPDWNREQLARQAGVTDRYVRQVLNTNTTTATDPA